MSWADDIRCLFCDGRLPLYRKITNGQFCSSAHRKAYWLEQERLAVERLHQTHDSLRAYRPQGQGTVEEILGNASLTEVSPEGANPIVESRPWWLPQVNAGQVPMGGLLPNPLPAQPRWLSDDRAVGNFQPFEPPNSLRPPVNVHHGADCGFAEAGTVELEKIDPRSVSALASTESISTKTTAIEPRVHVLSYPVIRLMVELVTQDELLLKHAEDTVDEEIPQVAGLLAIPLAEAVDHQGLPVGCEAVAPGCEIRRPLRTPQIAGEEIPLIGCLPVPLYEALAGNASIASPAPVTVAGRAALPGRAAELSLPALPEPGMLALGPMDPVPAGAAERASAVELRLAAVAPSITLATPPVHPKLRLSPGCRYPIKQREPGKVVAGSQAQNLMAGSTGVALPERALKVMRAAAGRTSETAPPVQLREPSPTGLLPLSCSAQPAESNPEMRPAPLAMTLPQPPRAEPMRPSSHLEPLDAKPIADVFAAPMPAPDPGTPEVTADPLPNSMAGAEEPAAEVAKVHFWTHGVEFWNHAPRDLKILLFAIPVLIGLAVHPPLPKVRVSAANETKAAESGFRRTLNQQWVSVRQSVLDRAAIALDEDFRSGLDDWVSRGDAPTEWSFDATGFVRPGPLAMFRPSLGLVDYQLQFLGLIDKKALSWVVRASDFENYYVIKLVVLKPGPLPQLGLVRYAVVNGKADARADTVVPIDARSDMLYRVNLEVHGDDFALYVQGQMVDAWSEPRLRQGGVGFFSARGEESRLRWVQVTHQYDMLGKLCAYLAPYNIPSTSGSWQP